MRAVVQLSDRVAVMNRARCTIGSPDEVMRDPRVVEVYFGEATHAA